MKRGGELRYQFLTFGLVLLTAGAEIAAKPVAHEVIGRVSTARAKTIWKQWKKKTNGSEQGTLVLPGRPHLWLRIPSCHISALVMHESDPEALHRFPASRVAESGAVIVYAHRDVHFRALAHIQTGDRLQVELADGSGAVYQVRSIEVMLPEQINTAVEVSGNEELFLLTCYPFRYIGSAPQRFLVRATKID